LTASLKRKARNAIKLGKIGVENDAVAANGANERCDVGEFGMRHKDWLDYRSQGRRKPFFFFVTVVLSGSTLEKEMG